MVVRGKEALWVGLDTKLLGTGDNSKKGIDEADVALGIKAQRTTQKRNLVSADTAKPKECVWTALDGPRENSGG